MQNFSACMRVCECTHTHVNACTCVCLYVNVYLYKRFSLSVQRVYAVWIIYLYFDTISNLYARYFEFCYL